MAASAEGLEKTLVSLQEFVAELAASAGREREVAAGLEKRLEKLERCLAAKPWASGPEAEPNQKERKAGEVKEVVIGQVDASEAKRQELAKTPCIPGQVQAEQGSHLEVSDAVPKASKTSGQEVSAPPAIVPQLECSMEDTVWDKASLRAEPQLEYALQETVWDTCAIVGMPEVGKTGSVLLVVSLLLSVTLQVYLCYALLANPSFSKSGHFKKMLPHLERWRTSVAHSDNQLDASGSSLASRVCGNDQALSVAGSQLDLLDGINTYLGMKAEELEINSFSSGQFLCLVCLFIFITLVLRELRSTAVSLAAFLELPRGRETVLDGDRFDVISRVRLAAAVVVSALRTCISIALLCAGISWIGSTSSTTELILNAAALGFILDLDEVIFATMVPMRAHKFMRRLEPLHVCRPPAYSEALVPMLATFVVVGVSMSALVVPNTEDMLTVKRVLCGGEKDFVLFTNPAGYVVSRRTDPFDGSLKIETFEQRAVEELQAMGATSSRTPQLSILQTSEAHYLQEKVATVRSLAEVSQICVDLDTYQNGRGFAITPALFTVVRHASGLHVGLSLAEKEWTCREHVGSCDELPLLRTLCPLTCGCADPASGLIFKGTASGCPPECETLDAERVSNASCIDLEVAGTQNWKRYWRGFGAALDSLNHFVPQDFASNFSGSSCPQSLEKFALLGLSADICSTSDPFFEEYGLGTIIGFCPATCCGGPDPAAGCPLDCGATTP